MDTVPLLKAARKDGEMGWRILAEIKVDRSVSDPYWAGCPMKLRGSVLWVYFRVERISLYLSGESRGVGASQRREAIIALPCLGHISSAETWGCRCYIFSPPADT